MTIIDCFPFFQELDILEWRLRELYPVVDTFVLVEATRTHSGKPKPLHYGENRQRFARWNDKIRHLVMADMTDDPSLPATRRREMAQRNEILVGLRDVPDDALVMVSDLDEIPRREIVGGLAGQIPDGMIGVFIQRLYYYNLNTSAPDRPWPGTRIARAADVRALSPHVVRCGLGQPDGYYPHYGRIENGGWHYSYFGGVDSIRAKQDAFLHQELVNPETTDEDAIKARVVAGTDIWGRTAEQSFVIGPASDLPWAVRSEPHKWTGYFHPDWRPTFHEDWYDPQCAAYVGWLAQQAPGEGAVVEIGSWEGRSAVCIAQSIAPRTLHCVDHWRGNEDEGDEESTKAAQERDVLGVFVCNMERLTAGNWQHEVLDWREWIKKWGRAYKEDPIWNDHPSIAFLHLDASHDYQSVYDCLRAILPYLVPGAILCGDDFYSDGVYRAVHDALGDGVQDVGGRLWAWQNQLTEGV